MEQALKQTTTVNVRVDVDLKREVESVCENLGMNISTAVNMFFRQMLMNDGLPFKPTLKNKRQSLNDYLESYHGKNIEVILQEAEENNEVPTEMDWGQPVGEEVW